MKEGHDQCLLIVVLAKGDGGRKCLTLANISLKTKSTEAGYFLQAKGDAGGSRLTKANQYAQIAADAGSPYPSSVEKYA